MDWIENKIASLVFCKTRRNLMDSEKLHFFGFIGGQEGEHRGRFDATGLREDCNDHSLDLPVCAKEKTIIFSLFPSARGRKRSFFESSHLREGCNDHSLRGLVCTREAKRRFTGGRRTPFGEDQIFLFF